MPDNEPHIVLDLGENFLILLGYIPLGVIALLLFGTVSRLVANLSIRWLAFRARRRGLPLSPERHDTLRNLIRSVFDGISLILTVTFLLSIFVSPNQIATTLGLFSAALAVAARPYISDTFGGLLLLVRDSYAIGERVEIGDKNVVGTVEDVELTVTRIRGESGELYIVPNGDVRTVRNFSRASFAIANLRLTLPTAQLPLGMELLREVIADPGPDIVEPPEIVSEGQVGTTTELLLKVKAVQGQAAAVRRRLLTRLYDGMTARGIVSRAEAVEPKAAPLPHPAERSDALQELEQQLERNTSGG